MIYTELSIKNFPNRELQEAQMKIMSYSPNGDSVKDWFGHEYESRYILSPGPGTHLGSCPFCGTQLDEESIDGVDPVCHQPLCGAVLDTFAWRAYKVKPGTVYTAYVRGYNPVTGADFGYSVEFNKREQRYTVTSIAGELLGAVNAVGQLTCWYWSAGSDHPCYGGTVHTCVTRILEATGILS